MRRKRYIGALKLLLMALSLTATLTPTEFVFGAGPAFRSSGRSPSGVHRSRPLPKHFGTGFLFSDGFSDNPGITVQQTVVTPSQEPKKAKNKGVYVPPHWVDADYGVQLLVPGHWVDPETKP